MNAVSSTLFVLLIAAIVETQSSETTRMVCDCRTVPSPKFSEHYGEKKPNEEHESADSNDYLVTGDYHRPAKPSNDGSYSAALKTISGGDANSVSGVFVY